MRQFINSQNLSKRTVLLRVLQLDPLAEVVVYESSSIDFPIIKYISVDSILPDAQLENLFSTAETTEETDYFANAAIDKQSLKDAYQNTITRLEQIQNAGSIPFTLAGFSQVVQAVKDEALYIEKLMQFIRTLLE